MATAGPLKTPAWVLRGEQWGDRLLKGRFMQQTAALLWKNGLVAWRSRRSTSIRLAAPFVFLLLALIINAALNSNNRQQARVQLDRTVTSQPIGAIPDCNQDLFIQGKECVTFLYAPNTDIIVNSIVQRIRENNVPPIPANKVLGFRNISAAEDYMSAHPDGQLGAVYFFRQASTAVYDYSVQSNSTAKYFKGIFQDPNMFFQVPMMNAAAREIANQYLITSNRSAAVTWAPALAVFPHPALTTASVLASVLGPFIFAALMFSFVTQMSNLVTEKELGLRQALRNMGMKESAYWFSWAAFDVFMSLIIALLICIFGMILRFNYFLANDFGVLFMLFWLFAMAMSSFSYFLSVFIHKSQSAVYLGFVVFIVGWIFQIVQLFGGLPYAPEYYYDTENIAGKVFFWIFELMPWNPLTKGILDLGAATANDGDPGIKWSERKSYCQYIPSARDQPPYNPAVEYRDYDCFFSVNDAYITLVVQWVAYLFLAVWLNNVVPNELGNRRAPWYPLLPSYWFPRPAAQGSALKRVMDQEAKGVRLPPAEGHVKDEDVAAEEAHMRALLQHRTGTAGELAGAVEGRNAAELYALRKVFPAKRGCCGRGGQDAFWAIKGSWLGIEENKLFCLLGPNGAGKTTTINCLTGVLPPSGGDALIYGQSICTPGGLDNIHQIMGVCPQFDVLWGELNGSEHLNIYGHVKGIKFSRVRTEAAELLEKVKLTYASRMRSSAYSGGMKRRLSVAISLLGDPKIVYLDEPTTGMDPISRRYVWDIIAEAKAGRAIVLTTHSMEEADILGDRIAIMARGHIRALGSSIRLKQKFGAGYQLSISVMSAKASQQDLTRLAAKADAVKALVRQQLGGLEPVDQTKAYVSYVVTQDQEQALIELLHRLEDNRQELGITDVQLSLTSLEEVFLSVARQAELEAAAASGDTTVEVHLDGGGTMMVPLGEEHVVNPNTGVHYEVKWAQDDAGKLVVLTCKPMDAPPSMLAGNGLRAH